MNLRAWLRRSPQPHVVEADGKRVAIPEGSRRWSEVEQTILTMGASRVSACSADGSTLRAMTLDGDGQIDETKPVAETDLQTFAKLLANAYRDGASATKDSYALAFTENTKLVGLLAQRLGALEAAWQKSMVMQARLQQELAIAGAPSDDATIASLLGNVMLAGPQATPNGGKGGK